MTNNNRNIEFVLDVDYTVGTNKEEDSYEVYSVNDDITTSIERSTVERVANETHRNVYYVATLMAVIIEKELILTEELIDSLKIKNTEENESLDMERINEFVSKCLKITPAFPIRSLLTLIEELNGYELDELLSGEKNISEFLPE